ncbi:MAG: hypothetical protein V4450_04620 [Bacteroidota bacterium]
MKRQFQKIIFLFLLTAAFFNGCSKSPDASSSSGSTGSGSTVSSVTYKGALVGSTGYLNMNLQGSGLSGANHSYILVTYIDSSRTPVFVQKDSLTTSSLTGWQPGTAIANALFTGSSGISVTLVSLDADGSNPVTKITVPNDPHVKSFLTKETVSNTPLLIYIGKAVPSAAGISGAGGTCSFYTKTINFIINPAYVGNNYAAATAIYIDSASHLAGFLTAQIWRSNTNQLTQIINNNDTAGLHVNNIGGPNNNNGSGPVNGTLQFSSDGSKLTGTITGIYLPFYGSTSGSCSCSYYISAVKVQ